MRLSKVTKYIFTIVVLLCITALCVHLFTFSRTDMDTTKTVPHYTEPLPKESNTAENTLKEAEQDKKTDVSHFDEPSLQENDENKEESPDAVLKCSLSVECTSVFNNISQLDASKQEIIPQNGIIFPQTEVVFYEGESVFNVLSREMKKNKIHLDFTLTPLYNTAYIKGISNLYEKDCGDLSGWIYMVNGKIPSYGCSQYYLSPGDIVEWKFTCQQGRDIK